MKKIRYVIYICNDEIILLDTTKNIVNNSNLKSIKEDQIIDSQLFIDEFSKFIKQNHIKISLFGDDICFIKNKNINNIVLEKYDEVLKEYFHKIEFKDLEEILKIDNDNSFLNITKNYMDYYFMKKNEKVTLRINLAIFNNNLNKAIGHLMTTIYKPKKIMLFGNQDNISKTAENISHDYNIIAKFPEVHYNYIFDEYRK